MRGVRPWGVCLAPGHGGADPGALSGDTPQLVERSLAAMQAWEVARLLRLAGFRVSICPQERNGVKYPNSQRVRFANRHDSILVAMHFNAGGGRYGLVEWATDNPNGVGLAECLRASLAGLLCRGGMVSDVRAQALDAGERGHVCIGGATHAAALTEPLFLDCPAHADWLRVQANRAALARAVAVGIVRYSEQV